VAEEHASSRGLSTGILSDIWDGQLAYNDRVKELVKEKDWVTNYVLGLHSETDELLREIDWKHHRKPDAFPRSPNQENVAMELADITKYALCLWQHFNFSMEEMLYFVQVKNEIMAQRLNQEFLPPPEGVPVLITDLDGTLADFRTALVDNMKKLGCLPNARTDTRETMSIDTDLGITYPAYLENKRFFEEHGGYRNLPAYEDGLELVRQASEAGVYVVAVTARPTALKRVWYDTWMWLRENGLRPDQLLMGENERVLVVNKLAKRSGCPVVLLEDDPVLAQRASSFCHVVLRAHPYNVGLEGKEWITRTKDFTSLSLQNLWETQSC
jgi:NTP pyrophosphatase (non-canonical NTP hydrolase)